METSVRVPSKENDRGCLERTRSAVRLLSSLPREGRILIQTARALARAWFSKDVRGGRIARLPLPVATHPFPPVALAGTIQSIDRWVRLLAFRTRHLCFYRTYAIATILRRRGLPLQMNVGLCNLKDPRGANGHCWSTLDGEVIAEEEDPRRLFPLPLGSPRRGVQFWVGPSGHGYERIVKTRRTGRFS